jgi:uncharacterized protein (TIGR00730 family)
VSRRVSIFGSSRLRPGDEEYEAARTLAGLLTGDGWRVVTGGYAGVMEAASRGAAEAGGRPVGVTVSAWSPRIRANPWVAEEVAAADIFDRLRHLLESEVLVAVAGGVGTLAELALAWNLQQPTDAPPRQVIAMGRRWEGMMPGFREHLIDRTADREIVRVLTGPGEVAAALRDGSAG